MRANHKDDKSVKGMSVVEIKRGQVLTSQIKLSKQWGWNPKTVKRFLILLRDSGMIEFKADSGGDSGYTLITLLNYNKFQGGQDSGMDTETINEGPMKGERVPTNNNDNNAKNTEEREEKNQFSFLEFWLKYPKKVGKKPAERYFQASVKTQQDWLDINKALDSYLRSERVRKGFVKDAATWFREWQDWVDYVEVPKTVNPQKNQTTDSQSSEDFRKSEEERIAKAREYFFNNKDKLRES